MVSSIDPNIGGTLNFRKYGHGFSITTNTILGLLFLFEKEGFTSAKPVKLNTTAPKTVILRKLRCFFLYFPFLHSFTLNAHQHYSSNPTVFHRFPEHILLKRRMPMNSVAIHRNWLIDNPFERLCRQHKY